MPLILGQHSTVFHSLEKENDKLCLYPWSGLVVNPDGSIDYVWDTTLNAINDFGD